MSDETKIEPALSAEQWTRVREYAVDPPGEFGASMCTHSELMSVAAGGDFAVLIALANAALPDSDPRKITWEIIDKMRRASDPVSDDYSGDVWLSDFADALASYLPPRATRRR